MIIQIKLTDHHFLEGLFIFVLFLCRNFFENQEKPPEPKPVLEKKRSTEWKPRIVVEETKNPVPAILSPKPVGIQPKPKLKEPQNQADLVRLALAAQKDDGPIKPRAKSEPLSHLVRGVKWRRSTQ